MDRPQIYSFPALQPEEIIAAFAVWSIPVTIQQLNTPTPEFVETVYLACLKQVTNLGPESFRDYVQTALEGKDHADLYSGHLTYNITNYHLNRLAEASLVENFSSKDMSFPTRDRTLAILSAFINFIKHGEGYTQIIVTAIRERSAAMISQREKVTIELDEVRRKIQIRKNKLLEDEPRCVLLRENIHEIKRRLVSTKGEQEAAVKRVEKLKDEKSELVKRKVALRTDISGGTDTIARTRQRIVQSPERIKRGISTMGSTAQEDKRTLAMHENTARNLNAKMATLSNIEKEVRGCYEQLRIIEAESRSLAESQKLLIEAKDMHEQKGVTYRDNHSKLERLANQVSNAEEKLKRIQRQHEEKQAASQRTLDRLKKEYDKMTEDRRENDKELEAIRIEIEGIQTQMAEHVKRSEVELNELMKEYWTLRHAAEVYMENVAKKLDIGVE